MSQKIKIQIAGRFYPMTVGEGEEELVRLATKNIEELLHTIESKYSIADKQDALAMAAIQYATKYEIQKKMIQETMGKSLDKIERITRTVWESLPENK